MASLGHNKFRFLRLTENMSDVAVCAVPSDTRTSEDAVMINFRSCIHCIYETGTIPSVDGCQANINEHSYQRKVPDNPTFVKINRKVSKSIKLLELIFLSSMLLPTYYHNSMYHIYVIFKKTKFRNDRHTVVRSNIHHFMCNTYDDVCNTYDGSRNIR